VAGGGWLRGRGAGQALPHPLDSPVPRVPPSARRRDGERGAREVEVVEDDLVEAAGDLVVELRREAHLQAPRVLQREVDVLAPHVLRRHHQADLGCVVVVLGHEDEAAVAEGVDHILQRVRAKHEAALLVFGKLRHARTLRAARRRGGRRNRGGGALSGCRGGPAGGHPPRAADERRGGAAEREQQLE